MKRHSSNRLRLIGGCAIAVAASVVPAAVRAQAQSSPEQASGANANGGDAGLSEIVVTAQRRSESQQKVPMAITAITPETAATLNITDVSSLTKITPGLSFSNGINYAQTFIRGVGSGYVNPGLESAVAVYIDDVYVERNFGAIYDILDPKSIQVLKGPQGALYGRNATGGAILIETADPEHEFAGHAKLEYGRFDHELAEGAVNIPLTDTLSARVAGRFRSDGGYIQNVNDGLTVGGQKSETARAKLAFEPGSGFKAVLTYQYDNDQGSPGINREFLTGPYCALCGATSYPTPTNNFYSTNINIMDNERGTANTTHAANLRMSLNAGVFKIESISGYRKTTTSTLGDFDFTDAPVLALIQNSGNETYTQDLQASTDTGSWYDGFVGVSYLHDTSFENLEYTGSAFTDVVTATGNDPINHTTITTESISPFFELTLRPIQRVQVAVGGRYTRDERKLEATNNPGANLVFGGGTAPLGNSFRAPSIDFSNFSPRVTLTYDLGVATLYTSFNKGFKAGGFNAPSYRLPANTVDPETIKSYELGVKYVSPDRRFRFNLDGFYYKYDNLQQTIGCIECGGTILQNAASATGKGIELDGEFVPTEWLRLFSGVSFLDAKYDKFTNAAVVVPVLNSAGVPIGMTQGVEDLSGYRLPHAPRWSGYTGVALNAPIGKDWSAKFNTLLNFTSSFDYFPGADGPIRASQEGAYATVDMSVAFGPRQGPYEFGLYARNLTNRKYTEFRFTNAPFGALEYPARPITYGASFNYNF